MLTRLEQKIFDNAAQKYQKKEKRRQGYKPKCWKNHESLSM